MIRPVNGHLMVEPKKHDSFISSSKTTYEEVGIVIDRDIHLTGVVEPGDIVYFDSWLVGKFPKSETEDFWLVKYEDVRAIDTKDEVSK